MVVYLEKTAENLSRIAPNCIKNRFDLCGSENCCLIRYRDKKEDLTLMVRHEGNRAWLGLYLVPISERALKKIVRFIFKTNKNTEQISYEYGYQATGTNSVVQNHFRIRLPETPELLDERLSKKGRYNIAREKRILEREFGEWAVHEYDSEDSAAAEAWGTYFQFKAVTHGSAWAEYDWHRYRQQYGVSTVYTMTLGQENKIAAVILSCEQCPVTYIENLTYDTELSRYSPGQVLYDEYLKNLIRKGKKEIFLLGGNYAYKKRYGSEEEQVYRCSVIRNEAWIRFKVWCYGVLVKMRILKDK